MDLSHLDKKYFIDPYIYNCPFCRRNNVPYTISDHFSFDWTDNIKCYVYLIECSSCDKRSLHFCKKEIRKLIVTTKMHTPGLKGYYDSKFDDSISIDDALFFSQPTTFFTLDTRIHENIRNLITEAENCRKAGGLVGASACIRKSIYVLLENEHCLVVDEVSHRARYTDSIAALKVKYSWVSSDLFDTLSQIQELTSDLIHEGSWNSWDSKHIILLIELLKTILMEMYIIPDEKKKGLGVITELKKLLISEKKEINNKLDKDGQILQE